MSRWVYDEIEYESGSKWFARWHRGQDDDHAAAIDLDVVGYCKQCRAVLYLVEATRGQKRKTASVTEGIGGALGAVVWVVYQDKTGARPGEILVDDRTNGTNHGWLPEEKVWQMLMDIRSDHQCWRAA